jgi:hypothetical protein
MVTLGPENTPCIEGKPIIRNAMAKL